jgi:predicted nucleotidyltransferase
MEINPIKRIGVAHDSKEVTDSICSASAVREMLLNNERTKSFLPPETYSILEGAMLDGKAPADFGKLESAVLYKLRTMSVEDFTVLCDVSEGLEYRLYTAVRNSSSLNEILEKVKTKRYTLSRIRRIILCAFLGITRQAVEAPVPYIRVLGFNENGARLLKEAKEKSTLPIVTKPSQIKELGQSAQNLFDLECTARDLFSLALPLPDICGKEMTDKIIVKD